MGGIPTSIVLQSPPPWPSPTRGRERAQRSGEMMDCQLDIFFLEALINGLLLAGLLGAAGARA